MPTGESRTPRHPNTHIVELSAQEQVPCFAWLHGVSGCRQRFYNTCLRKKWTDGLLDESLASGRFSVVDEEHDEKACLQKKTRANLLEGLRETTREQ